MGDATIRRPRALQRASQLAALVGLVACGVAPSGASGQAQVFGSPLTATPNVAFGCETAPVLDAGSGNYFPAPSNTPDCTWRQQGVFGSPAGDTRFSSVPGNGRIIRAEVLSGAGAAPLRFTVLSQLAGAGVPGGTTCCYFATETAGTFQPQAGVRTPFPLNLPVQRNTAGDLRRFDLVGFSAASNAGTLPLHSNGNNNAGFYTTFGSPNAGFFFPRVSSADGLNARNEGAIPGIEVLVRWTWCPAGQACGQVPTVRGGSARARGNRALIDLVCGPDVICEGVLELFNRGGASAAAKRKSISYGSAPYSLGAGAKATVAVKLKGPARRILKRKGKLKTDLALTPTGASRVTRPLKVKKAAKKKGRGK
jgi:hypothetical protein